MHTFGCDWVGPLGDECTRDAVSGRYCRWHQMGQRVEAAYKLPSGSELKDSFAFSLVFVLSCKFFVHGMRHVLWLCAGKYADSLIAHDPFYAPFLLGLSLIFTGKLVSLLRNNPWLLSIRGFFIPAGIAVWFIGGLMLTSPHIREGTYPEMIGWVFILMGFVFLLIRSEFHSGLASPFVVLSGLAVVFLSGVMCPVMEVMFKLKLCPDYLPPMSPALRQANVNVSISGGIYVIFASLDGIIALHSRGRLFTLFGSQGKTLLKRLASINLWDGLVAFGTAVTFVCILFGQGYVLRFCLWAIAHRHLFDFVPYYDLWYAAAALGIHYWIQRRLPDMESIFPEDHDFDG